MKIAFLIHNVYGIGGTNRTTLNLAAALADRHQVEIVSVFRSHDKAVFTPDPRVRVTALLDVRPGGPDREHPLRAEASRCFPRHEARFRQYSALTDRRVREYCAATDADVLVGTRPGLIAYLARFGAGRIRIGQEHLARDHHKGALRAEMYPYLAAMDAFVAVSAADAEAYRAALPRLAPRIHHIANGVPAPPPPPDGGVPRENLIVAAGRLASGKDYGLLIDAFARLAPHHPRWRLEIFGEGPEREHLERRIARRRMAGRAVLRGPVPDLAPEWARASIAASASRRESFGMTLVEAMRSGVPAVSTDCDYGPREIIRDGKDGLLVPVGDAAAMAAALRSLIENPERRALMAAAALAESARFDPANLAAEYEELIGGLAPSTRRVPEHEELPVVDAGTEPDGTVVLRLRHGAPPGAGGIDPAAEGAPLLVCSARQDRTLRVPLVPDADGTVRTAPDEAFAPGLWDVHLHPGGGDMPLPVRPGRLESAPPPHGWVGDLRRPVRLVRPGLEGGSGRLYLRSWNFPLSPEVEEVRAEGRKLVLLGRLVGPGPVPDGAPVPVLRLRGGRGREFTGSGSWTGERAFRLVVPCRGFAAGLAADAAKGGKGGARVWDLHLRLGGSDGETIRPRSVLAHAPEGRALPGVAGFEARARQRIDVKRRLAVALGRRRPAAKGRGAGAVVLRVEPYRTEAGDVAVTVRPR
ncbi:hypothetical protein BIV57_19035 [Mangrovactinospora gilvigrisea]|uniref:D-inositol 3-phosphate glycosyltransferase n=1 Tax=Mangrovactinospora gilvigrisea TaxID=1428644 RepID=A0A1J7BR53_9ACTN|nr:glycosyltransferase [Mangrovactinospora gilvigrisea]OIV35929.1 hypothetical protein BIV57_19035 [Mangrovactinospora gilvigrisea]